jgi:membrane-bound lytic murein transglycosylase B
MNIRTILLSLLLIFPNLVSSAQAADLPQISQFIDEMVAKHQFQRDELVAVFQRAKHRPEIIKAMTLPATSRPWLEYRATFVNEKRINGGVDFQKKHEAALLRAEREYGVPQEIIVAIIGVETIYGQLAGRFNTLDALTTLAFDFPRRADFFRSELEHFLLLAREQSWAFFKVPSSYAGAIGIPQFMPSSYRKHAVDFNGDGKIDLVNDPVDAIGSVGHYLKQYGWIRNAPVAALAQQTELNLPSVAWPNGDLPKGNTSPSPNNVSANHSCLQKIAVPPPTESHTLAAWAQSGVRPALTTTGLTASDMSLPAQKILSEQSARLLTFTIKSGEESWLAFENFKVITLYNNSNFYAMTVHQLAEEIRAARGKN